MRPRRCLLVCCLYAVVCFSTRAETIALTTGQDDPPFTDKTRSDGGIATRLVLEVFHAMGAQIGLDWLPWRRGYSLTRSGVYQASFPYLKTAGRERDFLYSEPIFTDFSSVWTRADDAIGADDPTRFKGLDFHVIFSHTGTGDLPDRFNAALRRMKDDGRYAALMAR